MRIPLVRSNNGRSMDLQMTSMIDVIFLLLVFFVCTASFQRSEELLPTNLSLPGSVAEQIAKDPELQDLDDVKVRIHWDGESPFWEIDGRVYLEFRELRDRLALIARIKRDLPVILRVEGDVPIEHVIDVYDLSRALGLMEVRFAASAALGEGQP